MHCKQIETKAGKRWQCIDDASPDPVTGKRRQVKRRAKTQREAKKKVEKAIAALDNDNVSETVKKQVTFDMVAEHWKKNYENTGVKRGSVRVREKEIKIINRYFAKMPVYKITHTKYQEFINKIAPEYARTTVQGVNGCARMVFKQAIRDKIIKENPTDDVVIPQKRRTVEEIETDKIEESYLERHELEQFLHAVREHGLDLDLERFYLLAFSGMRSGELCALKWSDIKDNEIRITKTLYNEDNNMRKYELTPPKTMGSIRTITMEDEIMDLLKSHRKRQMRVKYQPVDYHNGNFVFARPNGYPFIQKNILTRMRRLLQYTDIEKKATPHIFRHTHISMMTEAGIDLATIMERVGHEDIKTTTQIYTHVTKKMKKDASDKMKSLYENALSDIKIK
ncbi:MAG TPA: site-specific integrase [Massilibacterium sp.]|nr:site-specific integrase [Massilibacterium sp.]